MSKEKCLNCTEKCPQEELACEIAKGRMYATKELIALQKDVETLKNDLESEIHRLENLVIDKTTSDEEKIKALVALECYNKVLNQLSS